MGRFGAKRCRNGQKWGGIEQKKTGSVQMVAAVALNWEKMGKNGAEMGKNGVELSKKRQELCKWWQLLH